MTDTELVKRFRQYAAMMRTHKATSCEASELDLAADRIEALLIGYVDREASRERARAAEAENTKLREGLSRLIRRCKQSGLEYSDFDLASLEDLLIDRAALSNEGDG